MTFVLVVGIDYFFTAALGKGEETLHFLRRVLQVVVHRNYVSAGRMTQPRHYCIVLSIVARKINKGHRNASPIEPREKNLKTVIGTAVVYDYNLMPTRDREILERAYEITDAAGAIEYRDHNRQSETACTFDACPTAFSHWQIPPWRPLPKLNRRTGISTLLATRRFRIPSPPDQSR